MKEEWRSIVGYEGLYEVSNIGRVRSLDRKVWTGKGYYTKKGRILKHSKNASGYFQVILAKNGINKTYAIHRIVAFAFITKIEGKNIINHIDGNRSNNKVSNLEWCTQFENMKHAAVNQLRKNNFNLFREQIVEEYINRRSNMSELSRKYKCSINTIKRYFKENDV